ncbi:SGNH/GDSL hydrolase family protein [Burkholderia vietnamiensis]|uniref:SGNH/GDSL hydrolase family protein n=1 Tax=Burkholderia vietnamiensis TaxID=60552 RepID=UPI00201296CE|nr:SGNH/GDSL hydrolase family protein [Burkholderia vietnamiensis]
MKKALLRGLVVVLSAIFYGPVGPLNGVDMKQGMIPVVKNKTGNNMVRGVIASFLGMLVMACSACGGGGDAPAAQPAATQKPECFIGDPSAKPTCIVDAAVLNRSIVNYGDDTRIKAVLGKAAAGQPITIAAIGGSVTQGAWCTQPQFCYVNRVFGWWQATFPQSKMTLINAGVAQTDSAFGAQRVQHDVLQYNPDFVIVDFDVNDQWNSNSTASYRDLVKQILDAPSHPAVIMLAVMDRSGHNAQDWHMPVMQEFNLPYVSEKNALLPEEQSGQLNPVDRTADPIHPNDLGHEVLAELVAYRLQSSMH